MERERVERYRREFPVTVSHVYLDNAGVAPVSKRVKEAVEGFLRESSEAGAFHYPRWAGAVEAVRRQCGAMINAAPEEMAFVRSTSHGLSLVAGGLDWRPGDNVITYRKEFPANLYPWLDLVKRGVEIRFVEARDGVFGVREVEERMDHRTRVVTLSSVQFTTGFRIDLGGIGGVCRRRGVLFCVDGIQSLGVVPVDVVKEQIDFLSADAHKWLLGPEGIGVFYCRKELCEELRPALIGWKSVREPFGFEAPTYELRKDAGRFEEGSQNLMGIFGLGAAVELLGEVGIGDIHERVQGLGELIMAEAERRGFEVKTPRERKLRGGIVTFGGAFDAEAVRDGLRERGMMVNVRAGGIRMSPHFYNTGEDILACFEEIDRMTGKLR